MTIQEQLHEKLQREYNDFLDKLRGMPPEQIIEAAYEKVIKEEILSIFADKDLLPDNTAKILFDKNVSLNDFYNGWRSADINKNEIITECVASMVFDYEHKDLAALLKNPDIMPDYAITKAEMEQFGYNDNSMMLPLTGQRAAELYNQGYVVFKLFSDASETEVKSTQGLEEHMKSDGIFGIESGDWLESKEYQELSARAKHPTVLTEEQPSSANKPPIMPDSSITMADMQNYGYTYEGFQPYEILPLRAERAIELFNQDCEVFLLYDDNGEGVANSIEEIKEHNENGGIFGIEYDVWLKSKEYQALTAQAKAAENDWKTYKAELSVPDDPDYKMEIILANNDEDAVNQAYECIDRPEMLLAELHELDENYNIIREVNLNADHSLRRFMNVDLIDFLGKIADKVIVHYPQDFKHDIEILWKKALLDNPAEQKLMWHCSAYGTHLLNEDEVLTKNTGAYGYWVDYRPKEPSMMGYVIEVTGCDDIGETVKGNVYEVGEYAQHAAYVQQAALPLDSVSLTYSNNWGINAGKTITVPRHEYDKDRHRLMCESGDVISIKYHPSESQVTMAERLQSEQRKRMCMQIGSTDEHLQKIDAKLAKIHGSMEQSREAAAVTNEGAVNEISAHSILQDAPADTPKSEIPVYKDYLDVAVQKGEKQLFLASQNLNRECGQAIDRALSENSRSGPMAGTQYVNARQAAEDVMAEYGAERVAWVLAGNVQAAVGDGRISQANRNWAEEYDIPKNTVYHLNAHRTIVESLVSSFRKIEQERTMPEKEPSSKEAEKDNAVGGKKPKTPKKPNRGEDR